MHRVRIAAPANTAPCPVVIAGLVTWRRYVTMSEHELTTPRLLALTQNSRLCPAGKVSEAVVPSCGVFGVQLIEPPLAHEVAVESQ